MISIITSTYKPENLQKLTKSITETIDVRYEIIDVHNPGSMSICEAYNLGASKANFDCLLFIHDDIIFQTKNWGSILLNHFKNPTIGVVGLVGSNYVPAAPSGWYIEKDFQEKEIENTPCIALDGVLLSCTKEKFNQVKFNSQDIKGFHGYDYDFSLRMSKLYQNFIIHDIEIEHFSSGNPNKMYLDNNIIIREKLGSHFNDKNDSRKEGIAFRNFLNSYFKYYPCNFKQIVFTLKFFPLFKINFRDTLSILKKYFQIIRYRKTITLLDA